ncbi:MAG TPA: hypothetical protein PLY45_00140 [bacterium]|nr:hypothetical protein [bacterium]
MPSLSEYLREFGTGDILLTLLILAIILFAREGGRIFRRGR